LTVDPKSYAYPADILKDRIILVTGASDGIGKTLACHIAGLGAQVILHGKDTKKLEAVYDEIEALENAPRPSIAILDLATADSQAYSSLASIIEEEFGRLDGLVHNAGILGERLSIEQYDVVQWQRVLHINLTAPFVLVVSGGLANHSGALIPYQNLAPRALRKCLRQKTSTRP